VVGTARRSRLGTCSRLGSATAAAAQAPLGLLVASRSSSLRLAMALGGLVAAHTLTKAMEETVSNKNQWLLAAVLAALLVAATWYCVAVWRVTPMPLYGSIILGVAAVMVLASGCGLIALMFYSHRQGYDEPARSNRTPRE